MIALGRASFMLFVLFLAGCAGRETVTTYRGPMTPVVAKHAKRGYSKPYKIKGKWYHPRKFYEYREVGIASYYGGTDVFHGRKTSNGETFDMNRLSAAHKTLPIPCVVRVTNLKNGRSLNLKINDRGPFVKGRIIDVSRKAAQLLGFYRAGTTRVKVETLVPESLALARGHTRTVHSGYLRPAVQTKRVYHRKRRQQQSQPRYRQAVFIPPQKPPSPRAFLRNTVGQQVFLPPLKPVRAPQLFQARGGGAVNGIFVQAGTFSDTSGARTVARALQAKRLPGGVKIYPLLNKGKRMYRVLLGPFRSSQDAKFLVHKIKKFGHTGAAVVYH